MYQYDAFDHDFVARRVEEFRGQVARRLAGELSEDEFKPLRLMNGLYLQLHAYMLRVAIPYGTLSSRQMRKLAHIARTYDKGYGHFTTRQNIQFNWPELVDTPAILEELAEVEMHAMQTSGNCIRNVTCDQFAGAARDEVEDPRPYAELIRQWSTLHPEFTFLPRKFKIAVTGSAHDRAAVRFHDIGLILHENDAGERGFEVIVGGGMGRTPMVGPTIRAFLPKADLLAYLEAVLRTYNQLGRRDNMYKARIKILVHEIGAAAFTEAVEAEFERIKDGVLTLPADEVARVLTFFTDPDFEDLPDSTDAIAQTGAADAGFGAWKALNVTPHKRPGYAIATISLKPHGGIPGDASDTQMDVVADLADRYSFGEIRVTHEQNLVLPHVRQRDLPALYDALNAAGLGTANAGLASDIIACPGLDYCALANARSIPVAQRIAERLQTIERPVGELKIKISGCINACGHHHAGHIGILGVDRRGVENYQLQLGGSGAEDAAIGDLVGPGFGYDDIVDAVETVISTYLAHRLSEDETFLAAYRRLGQAPFKEALYGTA